MALTKKINQTTARIGKVRFSYAFVFEPRKNDDGSEAYSCCVLIPKTEKAAVAAFKEIIEGAKEVGKQNGKWGGKVPANLKTPLRDGDIDKEDDPNFAGCYFFNCKSKNKPNIAVLDGGQVSEAFDNSDFYSGCYGAVVVNCYPYDSNGNKGIGVGLQSVIKTEDGEKLSGGAVSTEQAFGDLNDII